MWGIIHLFYLLLAIQIESFDLLHLQVEFREKLWLILVS